MATRLAVLGSPVAHSLSPVLHTAAYEHLGLTDWRYERHEVDEGGLAPFVHGRDPSWRGLSLTMPLKQVAFEVASSCTDLAHRAGAVNTLVRDGDGWHADNTDVAGLVAALRDAGAKGGGRAVVIGSGATARSAVLALEQLDMTQIHVAARRPKVAAELVALTTTPMTAGPLSSWLSRSADVVIATLPGGVDPSELTAGLGGPGPGGSDGDGDHEGDLTGTVLLDVVYAGWPTPIATAAAQAGARVVSGLEMLIHQAARQVELFTGREAPLAVMQQAGRAAALDG